MKTTHTDKQVFTQAVIRSAVKLGLARTELADILQLKPSTVDELLDSARLLDPEDPNSLPAAMLIGVFQALSTIVAEDEQSMRSWLRNDNLELGGVPINLMARKHGLQEVFSYLDHYIIR